MGGESWGGTSKKGVKNAGGKGEGRGTSERHEEEKGEKAGGPGNQLSPEAGVPWGRKEKGRGEVRGRIKGHQAMKGGQRGFGRARTMRAKGLLPTVQGDCGRHGMEEQR